MGSIQAIETAEDVRTGTVSLEESLRYHLQCNHYPPVHSDFIPIAQKAIELCRDERFDEIIEMPNGKRLTAGEIIEGLHLDFFLE